MFFIKYTSDHRFSITTQAVINK